MEIQADLASLEEAEHDFRWFCGSLSPCWMLWKRI